MKVAAVKYLNTLPMLAGLQGLQGIELYLDDPAACARMLLDDQVDIALCPVGALVDIPDYHIISNVGIGCLGPVRTVAVYSHLPLKQLKAIRLFGESRSSNLLIQVIEKQFLRLGLNILPAESIVPDDQYTGQLCIGDRCFDMEKEYPFVADLGELWYHYTTLPFVFACWVSIRPVEPDFVEAFSRAVASELSGIDEMVLPETRSDVDVRKYLLENIRYELDADSRKALQMFTHYARGIENPIYNADPVTS